ncbi:MAG TPA: ATP-binding protein [Pyrinomonadaceae bacterium]|nr:ATP-binding protein [Pyrinomonadaceae bacterium]
MNLFIKIFLWFLAAIALMVGVVIFLTWTTQTEPVVSRWQSSVKNQTNIFAETSAQIYSYEGEKGLEQFLERIRNSENIKDIEIAKNIEQSRILNEGNREILQNLYNKTIELNEPKLDFSSPDYGYSAKPVTLLNGEKYILVTQWTRPRPTPFFGEANYRYVRLLGLILTALAVCYALARYLSKPIVKLSVATKKLAAGELQTRVSPEIGKRGDEIGKLAKDFDEMAERIEALITSQQRLTRDISHELRSPLARLNVALELAKQKSNPENDKLLDRIEREGKKLNEMIGQILTLAKLESQSELIQKQKVNLCKLVERVAADANFEAAAQGKKVEFVQNADCEVAGNETLLRSAVENVLRNALRYTKDVVDVSLEKDKSNVVVKIRDHGEGVPENELDKLFKPFYRVAEARERTSGGVGLGLAIAEQAVTSHKGKIYAKNADGGGLEVEIKLPLNGVHQ